MCTIQTDSSQRICCPNEPGCAFLWQAGHYRTSQSARLPCITVLNSLFIFGQRIATRVTSLARPSTRWWLSARSCLSPNPDANACRCTQISITYTSASTILQSTCSTAEGRCPLLRRGVSPDLLHLK
eukprot:XP_001708286.1 Hypothetical protein GL50803_9935 [Giardia lamblia ATCC 50803]